MKSAFDIAADLDTPVSAFLKLKPFKPRFLLESVESGLSLGRYSFIGFGDCEEARLDASGYRVNGQSHSTPSTGPDVLECLRAFLDRAPVLKPEIPALPLRGGLVGAAGFDLARLFEPLRTPAKAPSAPLFHYVAPSAMLVFDHLSRTMALLYDGSEAERLSLRDEIKRALRGAIPPEPKTPVRIGEPTQSLDCGQFCDAVAKTKEHILSGDVYQLVLANRFDGSCQLKPFDAYRALRLLNPSSYMFYLELGGQTLVGASPEALVKLSAGRASMRPIAGTRPRGDDVEADRRFKQELLADPKEQAEHVMLVDLARNDLGRVAAPDSVKVGPFGIVERYSHVMHIVSGVEADLMDGKDGFDLFASAFPAGTLSGAPKVRALELIDQFEPVSRGFYGGTVGYFSGDGRGLCTSLDQAITIRTLVFEGDSYSYQAGAGIVADSEAAREYDEVLFKSAIMRRTLERVQEGI